MARGVPAAFAAIVRKLMSKKPDERYQNCAELRADLARWTDPARVRAILGRRGRGRPQLPAAAARARRGRPPPPRPRRPVASRDGVSLRDLGDAEPSTGPPPPVPMPPLPAIIRSTPGREPSEPTLPRRASDDSRWLVYFGIVAAVIGLIAILLIAILGPS